MLRIPQSSYTKLLIRKQRTSQMAADNSYVQLELKYIYHENIIKKDASKL